MVTSPAFAGCATKTRYADTGRAHYNAAPLPVSLSVFTGRRAATTPCTGVGVCQLGAATSIVVVVEAAPHREVKPDIPKREPPKRMES